MRQHMKVAVHPLCERDALADLEHRVLTELDPPMNLGGMPPTQLRETLSVLRTGRV
jgi:hypothetical protein